AWLNQGANLLLFGPPGGGKSYLAAALGFALVENGWRVLFTRTTDLVQRLQIARRELTLEAAIAKLDKYHLLILDDLAYVTKDQVETGLLSELTSARYERRWLLTPANQPFGDWGKVFPDPAMTVAVVDRLVHHATIFEMNVESYRRRAALERKRRPGRPPVSATIKPQRLTEPRIASPEMFPEAEMLPHLICSRPIFIGGGDYEAGQEGGGGRGGGGGGRTGVGGGAGGQGGAVPPGLGGDRARDRRRESGVVRGASAD